MLIISDNFAAGQGTNDYVVGLSVCWSVRRKSTKNQLDFDDLDVLVDIVSQ